MTIYFSTYHLSFYDFIILWFYNSIILWFYDFIILSFHHFIILSFYHYIILSFYQFIILSFHHFTILTFHRHIYFLHRLVSRSVAFNQSEWTDDRNEFKIVKNNDERKNRHWKNSRFFVLSKWASLFHVNNFYFKNIDYWRVIWI